eukprot:12814259-Prorocentrum_lima.AAC.1
MNCLNSRGIAAFQSLYSCRAGSNDDADASWDFGVHELGSSCIAWVPADKAGELVMSLSCDSFSMVTYHSRKSSVILRTIV